MLTAGEMAQLKELVAAGFSSDQVMALFAAKSGNVEKVEKVAQPTTPVRVLPTPPVQQVYGGPRWKPVGDVSPSELVRAIFEHGKKVAQYQAKTMKNGELADGSFQNPRWIVKGLGRTYLEALQEKFGIGKEEVEEAFEVAVAGAGLFLTARRGFITDKDNGNGTATRTKVAI